MASSAAGESIAMGAITKEPTAASEASAPPFSDVALSNGGAEEATARQAAASASASSSLTGVGPLRSARRLAVKQRIRLCDIISVCTGCEVEKKYTIQGESGETLYWAREKSNFWMRFCCGSIRAMSMRITDQTENAVIELRRPLNCMGCCCRACYPICTQELTVSMAGEAIGMYSDEI